MKKKGLYLCPPLETKVGSAQQLCACVELQQLEAWVLRDGEGLRAAVPAGWGLNDVCFSHLRTTERPLIMPEFVIHYILYTTSTCGLLFCWFLRWYQVCSAHKTLESTTNYYISENVSAKQCNCHLEITKKKSHLETKMSAIFQNWVSVYSSLNYISTHNHAVVALNENTQMGCRGIRV